MTTNDRRLELMPLSVLSKAFAKRNPKDHDIGAIQQSIERHGYIEPIVLDERTQRLVAGHGRVETLMGLQKEKSSPPDGVKNNDGEWLIPVLRGWRSASDAQAEAYLLASNRTVELGGWDKDMLEARLVDLAKGNELAGSGYDGDDLDQMLSATAGEDDVAAVPENVWVKPGDLFRLGKHKILCGDSTQKEDVSRLLAGVRPVLMVTDPPYGVEYSPEWRNGIGHGDTRSTGKVLNDDRADWADAYKLFPGDVSYVWHAGVFTGLVGQTLEDSGFELKAQIIWVKPHFALSRGHYHWQHEPCWYAVKKGATNTWHGDRAQSTTWEVATAGGFAKSGDKADDNTGGHGTPKPVELYRRAIKNSSSMGDTVYEPFSGSGTCIVACEELQRSCLAMELSPEYVQVAIERWEKFTGKKHEKAR